MTTVAFAPASVFCPHCYTEIQVQADPPATTRIACGVCQKAWELTLPTVTATDVSYIPDTDSLDA